jgi:ABC-2 type transport system ATP-binding protein
MIELQQLTKRYGDLCAPPSRKLAVDGISATIRPGVVTGFLGPNGAGKPTTMRMVLGLDRPTSGAALVNGRPYVDSPAPLAEVGALVGLAGGDLHRNPRGERKCEQHRQTEQRGRRSRSRWRFSCWRAG